MLRISSRCNCLVFRLFPQAFGTIDSLLQPVYILRICFHCSSFQFVGKDVVDFICNKVFLICHPPFNRLLSAFFRVVYQLEVSSLSSHFIVYPSSYFLFLPVCTLMAFAFSNAPIPCRELCLPCGQSTNLYRIGRCRAYQVQLLSDSICLGMFTIPADIWVITDIKKK